MNRRYHTRGIVLLLGIISGLSTPSWLAGQTETVVSRLGEWGTGAYQRVANNGNYAFAVAYCGGVDVIDISDVANPRKIANIEVQGYATDVAVSGAYAYVSVQDTGLLIFDVSDPSSIEPVGSYPTSSRANRIDVNGSRAYLSIQAADTAWVAILDVSNPSAPVLKATYDPGGTYVWFANVDGLYLYVCWSSYSGGASDAHIDILNISVPSSPAFVSRYSPSDYISASDLCRNGNYLYIATGGDILDIVNITNINAPVRASKYITDSNALDVKTTVANAYVACNNKGFTVVNISNPNLPYLVKKIVPSNAQFLYKSLFLKGNYAFFGAWYEGLQVFDISNPDIPQWTGACNSHPKLTTEPSSFDLGLYRVGVSGSHAFIADRYSGFKSIDISNPAAPLTEAIYPPTNPPAAGKDSGEVVDFEIVGSYAYIPDSYSLQIVDISNPSTFQKVGSIGSSTKGYCIHAAIQGNYAYCIAQYVFRVIDISNPATPQLKAAVSIGGGAYFSEIAVSGNYAYIIPELGSGLSVVDISNPLAPKRLYSVPLSGYSRGICLRGNYVYVTASDYGLHVIDISNPLSANRIATCDTPGFAYGVHVSGNRAYVADGDKGLQIIDITNPLTPFIAGSYDTDGFANGAWGTGNTAYLTQGSGKMSILNMTQGVYHTVTFIPGTGGGIAGYRTQKVLHGGSATPVRAMPSTGYGFVEWAGTGSFSSGNNPLTVSNVTQDMNITALFATTPWTISGTITTAGGTGLAGVVLDFSNSGGSATTAADGTYSRAVYNGWSGTSTPVLAGYAFTPQYRTYTNITGNLPGQDYAATIPVSATLQITSPNGGETWVGGSTHLITWTTTGTVTNVKLEYSLNSGTSWTTIIASTANINSFSWTLPAVVCNTCLVRVMEAPSGTTWDVSDAAFGIVAGGTAYFTQDLYTVPPALEKELHGVFAVDFNHDGLRDLIAPQHDFPPDPAPFNPARILAFTNTGSGVFIESTDQVLGHATAICPNGHVVGDFNGDGWDDVFIVDMGNDRPPSWGLGKKYLLFIQKANGTLVNEAAFRMPAMFGGIPYGAAAGDVDGNGGLDLVITTTGSPEYQLLMNNGQGYFQYETQRLPAAKPNWIPNNCQMPDVNKDGYPDIFMGEEGAHFPQDFIFLNDGTGHFAFAPDSTLPPRLLGAAAGTNGAHAADLNGDGWTDLVISCVTSSDERIQVLFNNGDGTFGDVSNRVSSPYLKIRPTNSAYRAIADVNGDGWPDLLGARNVWGGSFVPLLFINHAGAQFEDITAAVWGIHAVDGAEPPSCEFADMDGDGDRDAVGIYPVSDQVYVLVNQNPHTIPEAPLPYPVAPTLLSPADASIIGSASPILSWAAVPSAVSYELEVASDPGFASPVCSISGLCTTSTQVNDLPNSTTYYWRVRATNTRGVGPWSTVYHFSVSAAAVAVVVSPNGWESWAAGSAQGVRWTSSGLVGNVTIDLYRSGALDINIATVDVSAGTFLWNIPAGLPPGTDYRVRVYQGSVADDSNADFAITAPLISLDLWASKHAVGDFDGDSLKEAAVDFGAAGAWLWNNGAWSQLSASNPDSLVAADVDGDSVDEILADLGSPGLWLWNGGAWSQLSAVNAESMAVGDTDADGRDELAADFGTAGLWLFKGGTWNQLSGVNADYAVAVNLDMAGGDEIIGDFGPTGLWAWNAGVWTQLSDCERR